ncbi:DMT family transporter [Archangium primigenium]|uniref:DMT family transporter n=1 Tax=[Archangium] primigenium TaxID=2792470 RepID=UPI00195E8125|nr:DMT family transporter [Archangium primigenium]MBM7113985.1 DMT family transporter [Archangium primigenium]
MIPPVASAPSAAPSSPSSERLRADGVMLLVTALWGGTFVMVKGALGAADPFSFLALRFCVGALTLTAMARGRMFERTTLLRGALLGVFLFGGFAFQTWGLVSTPPSRSAFITGLYVVLVPLLGWGLFGRRPPASLWLGVGMALAGLYTLSGADLGLGPTPGDALTLGGAVSYAFHILFTERLAPKKDVVALVAVQLWVVCALSVACLPFTEVRLTPTPGFIGAVLFCGFVASALALSLQAWAQARTTAVRVALICCMEPVLAGLYSVGLGYEELGEREWLGGGLIVLGVGVAELSGHLWARWRPARLPQPE